MLIYNHKKEFIGIDKNDLTALGYSGFDQLLQESADFADLFIKTPGYIHNFKHVHWIDFIACADSNEDAKVIINAKGKNYKATITIEPLFLIQNPTKKSYLVKLNNLRVLTQQENEQISGDLLARPLKKTPAFIPPAEEDEEELAVVTQPIQQPVAKETVIEEPKYKEAPNVMHDAYDDVYADIAQEDETAYEEAPLPVEEKIDLKEVAQDFIYEENESFEEPQAAPTTSHIDIEEDFKLDLDALSGEPIQEEEPIVTKPSATPKKAQVVDADFDNSYIYDPKVASEELGLPIDLIEEFIQDFIAQAHEFKEPLYKSLDENDIDNIKILSHKLKGVAANLRIEDAFNILVTINTSNDINVISLNLARFYKIIAKLSGETIEETQPQIAIAEENNFEESSSFAEEIQEESFASSNPSLDLESELELDFKEPGVPTPAQSASADFIEEEDLYMDSFEPKELLVEDAEVPSKINVAELADDTFLSSQGDSSEYTLEDDFMADAFEQIQPETNTQEESLFELEDEPVNSPATEKKQQSSDIAYNKTLAANEIGIDLNSFNELLEHYIQESKQLLKTLQNAVINNDQEMWKKIAITLKGMSDNMRIDAISKELGSIITAQDSHAVQNSIDLINTKLTTISSLED